MEWKTEKRKIKDLIEYDKNPRLLTTKAERDIKKSLEKFDLVEIPVINKDNTIIAGHQRVKILRDIKGDDYEIEVRVPSEVLNENDFKEYLLRSNRNKAEWDWKMLEEDFEIDLLIESGFEKFEVEVDKLNIDNCFTEMDTTKKKVKVKNCEVCNNGVNVEVKFFLKNKTFDNYVFKNDTEKTKVIYDRIKDLINDDQVINVIIVDIEKEEEDEIIPG